LCELLGCVDAASGDASNRQYDLRAELLWAQLVERPVRKPHVPFDVTRIAGGGEFFDLGLVKAHGITPSWTDFKRDDFDVGVSGAGDILHTS